jgi:hypothetical protein
MIVIHIVPTLVELPDTPLRSKGVPVKSLPDMWLPVFFTREEAERYCAEVGVDPEEIETDTVNMVGAPRDIPDA